MMHLAMPDVEVLASVMGNLNEDIMVDSLIDALVVGREGEKTKMVLCIVRDDLHGIGQNIVKELLQKS